MSGIIGDRYEFTDVEQKLPLLSIQYTFVSID
jgi:hypothetical protein